MARTFPTPAAIAPRGESEFEHAENQKGPGVISSVAKGGGQDFHGSAYITARNSVLNANDWLSNYSRVARPENQYYYPGFTFGGPVRLPFTSFFCGTRKTRRFRWADFRRRLRSGSRGSAWLLR
jgi:hypothetical protein